LAIISRGKGEELVDVVEALWLLTSDVEALVEAVAVWFPPCCVTVTVWVDVLVFVTVGVVVCASSGEGGLAGEKRYFVTEATPAIIETRPNVRPALSRFLRVMLRSLGAAASGWAACLFGSSSLSLVMAGS